MERANAESDLEENTRYLAGDDLLIEFRAMQVEQEPRLISYVRHYVITEEEYNEGVS